MAVPPNAAAALEFPLFEAIAGRRSRRFGLGMELPSGPLAFESAAVPLPLSDLERSLLLAAATGVTGWSFGVPFGPDRPDQHAHYTERFVGRTFPTAAGIGTPALCFTDDTGSYFVNTRDTPADVVAGVVDETVDNRPTLTEQMVEWCRSMTVQLSEHRLDLPAGPPHMLEPNTWMANAPGSTLFMPIGDASEQTLGLLAMAVGNGNVIMDDLAGRTAGDLDPFIRSGLLDGTKRVPLSVLQQMAYEANCAELAFMGHNMVLALQALGLGGLYFNGLNRWSILGALAEQGIDGLGFRFVRDERWTVPNPVGLDGHYEALCPPYVPDMRSAVEVFAQRKFGEGGAYVPSQPGAWRRSDEVKSGVEPYTDEFKECLGVIAQHVLDTYGRFPNSFSTIVLSGYVQAVHLDTEFYDEHYLPGAYLDTHAEHLDRWHPELVG